MPRKSAASLSVISPIQDHRPPVPVGMPEAQADVWRAIVNRLPHDWFRAEHLALLQAYCEHVSIARTISQAIEEFDPTWISQDGGLDRLDQLTRVLEREHRAMVMLARSMRISHQSQYDKMKAAASARPIRSAVPPWEHFK